MKKDFERILRNLAIIAALAVAISWLAFLSPMIVRAYLS